MVGGEGICERGRRGQARKCKTNNLACHLYSSYTGKPYSLEEAEA
jgi:hypothetical protein